MGNLIETASWDVGVPYFAADAVLTGGPDCPDNIPIQALANRTAFLKKQIDDAVAGALTMMYANKMKTGRTISMTGDGTWTVTFDGSGNVTAAMALANSGVVAGTYPVITVDAKGRATGGRALAAADIPALDWSKLASGKPTTLAGYGITDALLASSYTAADVLTKIKTVDGAASGLDADLLDGQEGAYYLAWGNFTNKPTTLAGYGITDSAVVLSGTQAARPAAGTATRLYLATDTLALYRDNGATWDLIEPAITGDVTIPAGSTAATLANSGVVAGTYPVITVDAKGRATGGRALAAADIPALDWSKLTSGKPTTLAGYGITDALLASSYTAADVLTKIKTVDGAASGLDADLLDGQEGAYYLAWGNFTNKPTTLAGYGITDSAVVLSGTQAARPAAGTATRLYLATDTFALYRDNGATWDLIEPAITGDVTIPAGSTSATLANSGVVAGTYPVITVDAKGRATGGRALAAADIPALDWSKITSGKPTTASGYGITLTTTDIPALDWNKIFSGKPTTLAGYGITDAQALNTQLTAISGLAANGLIARTAAGTAAARTLTPGTGISVSNGDGVAGNPTVALSTSGVAAGTYPKVTVDSYGRVTAGAALIAADIPPLDWSKINSGLPTTLAGYGITDAPCIQGAFKNLQASATGLSANMTVTADEIALENTSNGYVIARTVNLTINSATTGANGLDTGAMAASTWYSVWVIWNGATIAGLISLSTSAPTLPGGYTHKARVGWIRTDGTANKFPLPFVQSGRNVEYSPTAASNLTAYPTVQSGSSSGTVSLSAYTPPTATAVVVAVKTSPTTNSFISAGKSAGDVSSDRLGQVSASSATATYEGNAIGTVRYAVAAQIYVISTGASNSTRAIGWEDNI